MTVIESIQTYIKTCTELEEGRPVWVNYLGGVNQYSIVPLPGTKVLEEYLNGVKIMDFPFAFQTMNSTADDLERLANAGFFESFSDWMYTQTELGNLPTLGAGQTAELIEAVNCGYLFAQGESDTGIYQIDCRLQYRQEKQTETSE